MLNRYSTWNRKKTTFFFRHYLRSRSALDVGIFGYVVVNQPKERSPEVWQIRRGTSRMCFQN